MKKSNVGLVLLLCLQATAAEPPRPEVVEVEQNAPGVEISRNAGVEPAAGAWKTYVLQGGGSVPVAAPPARNQTAAELNALRQLQRARTPGQIAEARYLLAGSPSHRWVEMALDYVERKPFSNPRNTRLLSMVNVAVYDAIVAAWHEKYKYARQRPAVLDPSLETLVGTPESPSYPSEHAVAAGAASEILAFYYPNEAEKFREMAERQSMAALVAGINYPSDTEVGLQLGKTVAKMVIERMQSDGSSQTWTGTVPVGPGFWVGTNPAEPLAGSWRPWVLPTPSMYRPGPPLAYDSAEKKAELEEIKNYPRAFASNSKAFFYQTNEGIFTYWYRVATQRIFEYGLDQNPPRAARVYALISITHHDAMIAGWEAKYAYWAMRPFMLDQDVKPLFTTPNHPSYPAAHGFFSGAIAHTLAYLFPNEAEFIEAKANEAADSRLWAGIHFRSDLTSGLELGRKVSDYIIEQAKRDGSQ
jgi:hypothetical protein